LEVLAAEGIKFTILAPRQAKRWRRLGTEDWTAIPDGIDPSRAYLCRLPSGRSIALFFYDGTISREVAFDRLLSSGEKFVARIKEGFDESRGHAQLVNIATDGESYGHHHAHGDMALAYALQALGADSSLKVTNYGEYLSLHVPEWEVEIHESSSWSCFHGVERWRTACGCCFRSDWQQEWRAPLREGFDALKRILDRIFEERGRSLLRDTRAARDAYIQVVLGRGDEVHPGRHAGTALAASVAARSARTEFLETHARPGAVPSEVLSLLEMQRNALLMFTSCAWFFDEISGIETVQCLRYAARALQLAGRFDDVGPLERDLLATLEKAPSNLASFRNGRAVWERYVRPAEVNLERVLAHYAVMSLFHVPTARDRLFCYEVDSLDHELRRMADRTIAVGRLHVRSVLTLDEAETAYVATHSGGLDFRTILSRDISAQSYSRFKQRLVAAIEAPDAGDVAKVIDAEFPGIGFTVQDLFADELRRMSGFVLRDRVEEYHTTLARLAERDADVLTRLGRTGSPIPAPLRMVASVVLDHDLSRKIRNLQNEEPLQEIRKAVAEAALWGYRPERERLKIELALELERVLRLLSSVADPGSLMAWASRILDSALLLEVKLDLWQTQNVVLETYARLADSGSLTPALHAVLARLADRLNISDELLGWRP
jgi:hypothetical protein